MHIHDPGHVALRRGIRAAIAVPVTLVLALYVVDDTAGLVFSLFGVVGLLVSSDFAGTWQMRLSSYLLTGVVGSVIVAAGVIGSGSAIAATCTTLVVAFLLGFVALLRGRVAAAIPAVQLIFVVAVSVGGGADLLLPYLEGWWLAVAVATTTALVVLPRSSSTELRARLAQAFDAAARAARALWAQPSSTADRADALARFDEAVAALDTAYGGKPFRPSGSTARDRTLQLLVFHLNGAHLLLKGHRLDDFDRVVDLPGRNELAVAMADGLTALGRAMRDTSSIPDARAIDDARARMMTGAEEYALERSLGHEPTAQIAEEVRTDHLLRMAALFAQEMIALARRANGAPPEELPDAPPSPRRSWWLVVRSQLNWSSPWLRNALRSALGLGLAVLVVQLAGLDRGFWVLLGVISILRFDSVGTRKFAWQALAGTIIGVVATTVFLEFVGTQEWLLWTVLPVMVFIAAWGGTALNFPVGQAAFTSFVLIGLGIADWPPKLATGLVRIEDILVGAVIAVLVALIMWPRGAAGELRLRIGDAIQEAAGFLNAVLTALTTSADRDDLMAQRLQAAQRLELAAETYDIALMQRGVALDDEDTWKAASAAVVAVYLVISTARVLSWFAAKDPLISGMPGLEAALAQTRSHSQAHWDDVAHAIRSSEAAGVQVEPLEPTALNVQVPLTTPTQAHAFVVGVWAVDWVDHLDRLGYGSEK
jgi:uncharacterized membrane protein YccC